MTDITAQIRNPELSALPDLYFIRHGQTDWNRLGRFQGASDIPLNETGYEQARIVAMKLNGYLAENKITPDTLSILSSPLLRARQTTTELCRHLKLDVQRARYLSELSEVSYGAWEGMTTLEVKERFPAERKSRKSDRWNFRPQGGDSHASRIPELKAFLSEMKSPTIMITHTGVIRVCLYLLGSLDRETALSEPISQDKLYVFSKGSLARV
ncbi:histidine phosphatase family protein [Hoeflea poritis]|uniref:Histidine phosphatase family protein n=1 Tax=Hoeflea poritis TaxID=2993659 RepID=A0ABT4VGH4_9HYPH|nr:histidine phosphatase family protein [Hoeflea poritis]MDA4843797.1 histidine phosphatase family protein [Hoeflea poritis]